MTDLTGALERPLPDHKAVLLKSEYDFPLYAYDCTPAEVNSLFDGAIPSNLTGESERLSFAIWAAFDGGRAYLRLTGLPPGFDERKYFEDLGTCGEGCSVHEAQDFVLPNSWHAANGPNRDPGRPLWFNPGEISQLATSGTLLWVQKPEHLKPCHNYNVSGRAIFRHEDTLYVYIFSQQHFFPGGGCGG